ncbi:MAG: 50S ribosomal protein L18 [Nanoarchaeota archaeon]|nr:50S ribosomal protein L18 [Nanoarchaeota archaeon]
MKRRRLEGKTDYKLRRGLLSSGVLRIVVRRTNKYFIVQVVESHEAQDKVIASVTSKDLLSKGWDLKKGGSLKSIPAGYLTGLLLAKKIGKGKFIMDLGMSRTIRGSRIFSVVKGLVDGGLNINADSKIFPTDERISGEHLKEDVKEMIVKVKGGIVN